MGAESQHAMRQPEARGEAILAPFPAVGDSGMQARALLLGGRQPYRSRVQVVGGTISSTGGQEGLSLPGAHPESWRGSREFPPGPCHLGTFFLKVKRQREGSWELGPPRRLKARAEQNQSQRHACATDVQEAGER